MNISPILQALAAPEPLPTVADPFDNFLLVCAEATGAHYLVSGDKADVLRLKRRGPTRIVALRSFARMVRCVKAFG